MKPVFVGIASGTGAGKSTVCHLLQKKYPETIGVLHLDDYFKQDGKIPLLHGMENFEHPDSLHFEKFRGDLVRLERGESVRIYTKHEQLKPHGKGEKRVWIEMAPKPVMLVEGYLVLHDEDVRKFFDATIYLDLPHAARYERRVHFKLPEYEKKVLIPMHREHVEPTRKYADHVLSMENLSKEEAVGEIQRIITRALKARGGDAIDTPLFS